MENTDIAIYNKAAEDRRVDGCTPAAAPSTHYLGPGGYNYGQQQKWRSYVCGNPNLTMPFILSPSKL
eukprot:1154153-Pelagomonas_calceolata.AAC.2